jgi:carboxyl-terminal processing protease
MKKLQVKKWIIAVSIFSLLLLAQPQEAKKQDPLEELKSCNIEELVGKIKQLSQESILGAPTTPSTFPRARRTEQSKEGLQDLIKKVEEALQKEFNLRLAIAYSYFLKVSDIEKGYEAWKKLLAAIKTIITKENIEPQLPKVAGEIALEISDTPLKESEEASLKEKFIDIFDLNTDPYISIFLGRAYQNLFTGDSKGIEQIKKVLNGNYDEEARMWAAINLIELDILDEASIPTVLDSVANNKQAKPEKRKLAQAYLNLLRLKRKLEDKESTPPVPPTTFDDKFRKIERMIRIIKNHYVDKEKVKEKDLIEACAKGIGDTLDAYSAYLDSNQTKKLTESVNMRYAGIGAVVSTRDGWLTIEQVLFNGPAYKVGLRSRDRIIKVDDEYTKGKTIEELVSKLKGFPGTKVRVLVVRAGWQKEKEFIITREVINMGTVKADLISPKVAYFRIYSFGDTTVKEFLTELSKLKKQIQNDFEVVIIDVRDNAGGYLDSVLKLLNYFIPAGKPILIAKGDEKVAEVQEEDQDFFQVYTDKEGNLTVKTVYANDKVEKLNFKNVYILVDDGTASAAEIFAGALQDYKIAKLVGTNTWGKGSIQQLFDLPLDEDGRDYLRLTIGKYFLPSGKSVDAHRDKFGFKPKEHAKEGGLNPDFNVEKKEPDLWVLAEKDKLSQEQKIIDYAEKLVKEDFELAKKLALNDNKSWKNYKDFNSLYRSLKTRLSKNHVREVVRAELRRKVMETMGKEIIYDIVDDYVLAKAIQIISSQLSISKENLGLTNKELPVK